MTGYQEFVQAVTEHEALGSKGPFLLMIGIDELDKITDDDKARQFLNEIKVVFNLEHCFYMVSVSENAINAFERRGLPFRDEFDSAFDRMLYVDYLTVGSSKLLLRRQSSGFRCRSCVSPIASLAACPAT